MFFGSIVIMFGFVLLIFGATQIALLNYSFEQTLHNKNNTFINLHINKSKSVNASIYAYDIDRPLTLIIKHNSSNNFLKVSIIDSNSSILRVENVSEHSFSFLDIDSKGVYKVIVSNTSHQNVYASIFFGYFPDVFDLQNFDFKTSFNLKACITLIAIGLVLLFAGMLLKLLSMMGKKIWWS